MELWSDKIVVTRKLHICDECSTPIPAGNKMRRIIFMDKANGIFSFYQCEICQQDISSNDIIEQTVARHYNPKKKS